MFSKIRNRLTLQYALVMAIFLLSFIAVSYSGVIWLLHREEQQDIRAYAEEEAREHVMLLKQTDFRPKLEDSNDENVDGKLFYYVFDMHGNLASANEPVNKMRSGVQEIITNWNIPDGEGKIKKFYLTDDEKVVLIMCSITIYDGQQSIGKVFVGEDITSYYEMLKTLLVVLLAASLFFIIIAAFVGHLLAGRAIIPIRQSFARQREFAADASHELRTPLSILLTSVDAVQSDETNTLSLFSTQVLNDMKSEVKRMTKIVSDLLTLARADAGVSNVLKEKFNLYMISEQLIRSFQSAANDKGLELLLDCPPNIDIVADKERINQLLLILVDNSIKYTSPGGRVNLIIKLISGAKQSVSIIVEDTGVGILEKQKNLIFERFYRVDKSRSKDEGGTGLGLSIAKWIVEAHGGTINVESIPKKGSTFIVNLPN